MTTIALLTRSWLLSALLLPSAAAVVSAAVVSAAEPSGQPDFAALIQTHGTALARVKSDAEGLALFRSLGPAIGLKLGPLAGAPSRERKTGGGAAKDDSPAPAASSELAETALQLTGDLAAWRLAAGLRTAADKDPAALAALLNEAAPQREWLAAGGSRRMQLLRAMGVADLLHSFEPKEGVAQDASAPDKGSEEYAAQLDRTIPLLDGEESWLGIAEREGAAGIRRRLGGEQPAADRYWQTRLKPLFRAQLAALALRAEAEAEAHGRAAWQKLDAWGDRQREDKGLAKLCGSWQWTIHNHQNHQDHKLLMQFEPPFTQPAGKAAPGQALLKPTQVVVLGDVVYLRWESSGGVQEDSLLFTGEGKRLEGSFVNSAGAWGSVTGKRLSACKN